MAYPTAVKVLVVTLQGVKKKQAAKHRSCMIPARKYIKRIHSLIEWFKCCVPGNILGAGDTEGNGFSVPFGGSQGRNNVILRSSAMV